MQKNAIYEFLYNASGNWRNSAYLDCGKCFYAKSPICPDFLFVPNQDGNPILLPATAAEAELGPIDKSECLFILSRVRFQVLYSSYLAQRVNSPTICPILQVLGLLPSIEI